MPAKSNARSRSPVEAIDATKREQASGRKGTVRNPLSHGKPQRQSTVTAGRDDAGKTKPHKYNHETAKKVKELSGFGLSDKEIAIELDLRPGQVREYYLAELTKGAVSTTVEVIREAYKQATSGNNFRATEFWLERRAGWKKPAEKVEVTGANGGLIRTAGAVQILIPDNGRPFTGKMPNSGPLDTISESAAPAKPITGTPQRKEGAG